ncbi:hypothetical protein N431DRAFT_474269 [Stipitochalara longipes BDJ]|nr:hypothetical protein N431DRAFT_474269 [Stipitochalara longipes BDJ]
MIFTSAFVAAFAAGALSPPTASNDTSPSSNPCGYITQQVTAFYSNSSNSDSAYTFKPSLGLACLQSSVIDNELATSYVKEVKKYLEFQSTVAYLKNPPSDYFIHPPIFWAASMKLRAKQLRVVTQANDLFASANNFSVSKIVSINGQNVSEYLENFALSENSDPDAAYNTILWNYGLAPGSGGFDGAFTLPSTYEFPDDYTNLTFANGTTLPVENYAFVTAETWSTDIVDGKTFTEFFCIAPAQTSTTSSTSNATSTTSSTASTTSPTGTTAPKLLGYPYGAVAKDPNNQVAGYFLNSTGLDDTAVLRIASFANETVLIPSDGALSFVNATKDFFAAAAAANKTKLIIDVSGNGGGNTLLPNDVFKRLFPDIEPYGASRLRGNDAANIYGSTFAAVPDSDLIIMQSDSEDPFYPLDINNGDNFTALSRTPLNSTLYDETTDFIIPYGYAGQPENPQPFATENIILLTDGICASACSIFAEFLTRQAGIKTIVVGGRPQIAPMQAIGGTKGSQAYYYSNLVEQSEAMVSNLSSYVPKSLISSLNDTLPGLNPLPLGDPSALAKNSLNLRDNISEGDTQGIPLQFIFEPANCRIFYTADSVTEPAALWEQVVGVAWGGAKCAWGSMDTVVGNNGTGIGGGSGSGSGSGTQTPTNGAEGLRSGVVSLVVAVAAVAALL